MIEKLEGSAVLDLIKRLPEQSKYDCKANLVLDSNDQKAELVKDITSIANAHGEETGYLFYGVDLRQTNPAVGLSHRHDDATLQQIVNSKLERHVSFVYYETEVDCNWIGIAVIPPSSNRPHIIKSHFGKLREGQIPIRRGSSTTWANNEDLRVMIAGQTARDSHHEDVATLLRRAGDPSYPVGQLALQTWQLAATSREPDRIEWLRLEIAGFAPGSDVPAHREVTAQASVYEINVVALSFHNLDSIVQSEPGNFKEVSLRLGQSIAELENMLGAEQRGAGFFQVKREFGTESGKTVEAFVYFKPDAIRRIVTSIRNRILQLLMDLHGGSAETYRGG